MSPMPGAEWRPVKNYTEGVSEHRGLVLHVQEGNGSPYDWFNNEKSDASSNFWVGKDGKIEQYVDAVNAHAWCQSEGNSYYASVETEGWASEPLTEAQIEAVAKIYAWGYSMFGWPLKVIDSTTEKGLTFHGAGGAKWGGHVNCPGSLRIAQREAIIALATTLVSGSQPQIRTTSTRPSWPGHYFKVDGPLKEDKEVRTWQEQMHKRGWAIQADGYYGAASASVCRKFQQEKGLAADGIVGPDTWNAAWL
ncbi:peptidoglycan recognition protein family protein [Streptomyces olivoreticuli]